MADKLHMKNGGTPIDQLREEFVRQSALFDAQPPIVQRFLESQARQISQGYVERIHTLRFNLPDRVVLSEKTEPLAVEPAFREQRVGTLRDRIGNRDVHETLRQRLTSIGSIQPKRVSPSVQN